MKQDRDENGQDNDVDQVFLDQILDKLYDFGDGAKGKRSKKKHKKKKIGNDEEEEEEPAATVEEEASDEETSTDLSHMNGTNHERIPLSTSLGTTSSCATSSNVEIVTFQDPLKKNRLKRAVEPEAKAPEVKEKKKKVPDDILSIEKARLEVHRFGITGFQKEQQRVFEQDRAIMLGARPPKRDFVNYKVYQQTMKEKRLKEKEETRSDTQTKKRKPGKSDKQKTEKRRKEPGFSRGETTGQMGRFKNGMLVVSNKDLQKLQVEVRKWP